MFTIVYLRWGLLFMGNVGKYIIHATDGTKWILGCQRNHWPTHSDSARLIPMLRHEAGILPCSFTKDAWATTSCLESWSHIIPNGPNVKVQQIPPANLLGIPKCNTKGRGWGIQKYPRLVANAWWPSRTPRHTRPHVRDPRLHLSVGSGTTLHPMNFLESSQVTTV